MESRYDEAMRKVIGLAFILGPVMLFIAALVFAAGIGTNPNDLDSYVEGAIGFIAMPLFAPIWVTLAAVIGRRYLKFGIGLTIFGFMSAATGAVPMANRMMQKGLTDRGVDFDVWELMEEPWMILIVIPTAPMFPLVGALIGFGLLKMQAVERWVGIALIVAWPLFWAAQAGGVAVAVTWTLTTLLYAVALVPIGWRIFSTGEIQASLRPSEERNPALATR